MARRYSSFSERRQSKKGRTKFIWSVILAAVFIFALIFWILPTFIGGLSFLNQFKPKSTETVTENPAIAPPVLNIPFEATSTASIKISGYAASGSKVEIYVDDELITTADTNSDGGFEVQDLELSIGGNNIYGRTLEDTHRSFPSKTIKIFYDREKPTLEVSSPTDDQIIVGDKKVTVSGTVDPQDTTLVEVNGTRLIINPSGDFSQTININEGENYLEIKAYDRAGNQNSITRKVTYPPQTTP